MLFTNIPHPFQMINGNQMYWQNYDNQDQSTLSLEQLIQSDQLERLLDVKTISFEIRSENQVVLDYLVKQGTLKRLLKHIFVATKTPSTDRAIEVFACAEALRNVFQTMLTTPELISAPFEILCQYAPNATASLNEELRPAEMAPVHIYLGCQKLFSAMMMNPKRVQSLVQYLTDNPKYLRAFVAHILSSQISEVFRTLVVDFKGRGDETCKAVSLMISKSNIVDCLVQFMISNAPLECVSNASSFLCQIVSSYVPYISEAVILKIALVSNYLMTQELTGSELLRLHYAGDFVVCGLSFMVQKSLYAYCQNEVPLQKVTYEIIQKRQQFIDSLINGTVKIPPLPSSKTAQMQRMDIQQIGINEIDTFERSMLPIFALVLNSFTNALQRVEALRKQAKDGLFGYGAFTMLQFFARLIALTADVKNISLRCNNAKKDNKPLDWTSAPVEDNPTNVNQTEATYGQLSLSAHAGCGGASNVEISQTFKNKQVPLVIAVPQIIRKLIKTGLISHLVDVLEQFELNSNLHFVISRVFIPLVEYGDSAPDISTYLLTQTNLVQNICKKLDQFIPFKSRTSLQTYYITFARSFIRIAMKLPDESAVADKQKFVAGKQTQMQPAPQHVNAMIKLATQMNQTNQVIYEFLTTNEKFKTFSQKCLEFEDEIPKAFGDVRLTAEFAQQKKPKKKNQGVFDAGFGNFGQQQQNDFFGFNQGAGGQWGDFAQQPKAEKNEFGFGWGDFQ